MTNPTPRLSSAGGQLDIGPIRAAILRDAANLAEHSNKEGIISGLSLVAQQVGILERSLYRIVKGEARTVGLDLVDVYCCKTGRHLGELYPHLYDDDQVDADVAERARLDDPRIARKRAQKNHRIRAHRAGLTAEQRRAISVRKMASAQQKRLTFDPATA